MRRLALTAVSLALALPSAAAAQEDGVFVDPESPTSKEYAIPLEDARRQASGGADGGPVPQGRRSAPLFGEGVDGSEDGDGAPLEGGTSNAGSNRSDDNGPAARGGAAGGSAPTAGTGAAEPSAAGVTTTPASTDSSSTPAVAGLAVGVLLLGGVLGSLLRRRGTFT